MSGGILPGRHVVLLERDCGRGRLRHFKDRLQRLFGIGQPIGREIETGQGSIRQRMSRIEIERLLQDLFRERPAIRQPVEIAQRQLSGNGFRLKFDGLLERQFRRIAFSATEFESAEIRIGAASIRSDPQRVFDLSDSRVDILEAGQGVGQEQLCVDVGQERLARTFSARAFASSKLAGKEEQGCRLSPEG